MTCAVLCGACGGAAQDRDSNSGDKSGKLDQLERRELDVLVEAVDGALSRFDEQTTATSTAGVRRDWARVWGIQESELIEVGSWSVGEELPCSDGEITPILAGTDDDSPGTFMGAATDYLAYGTSDDGVENPFVYARCRDGRTTGWSLVPDSRDSE